MKWESSLLVCVGYISQVWTSVCWRSALFLSADWNVDFHTFVDIVETFRSKWYWYWQKKSHGTLIHCSWHTVREVQQFPPCTFCFLLPASWAFLLTSSFLFHWAKVQLQQKFLPLEDTVWTETAKKKKVWVKCLHIQLSLPSVYVWNWLRRGWKLKEEAVCCVLLLLQS